MQTKQTQRLAERLRKYREHGKHKPRKWNEVCLKFNVLTQSGYSDTGLAYKIAYNGYEPEKKETRERLGLRNICLTCQRPFRKPGPRRELSPAWKWWNGLKRQEQENWIERIYKIS